MFIVFKNREAVRKGKLKQKSRLNEVGLLGFKILSLKQWETIGFWEVCLLF